MVARPPRALVMVGAYATCARCIQRARETGLEALFLNVFFFDSVPPAQKPDDAAQGVVVTQLVPDPKGTGLPMLMPWQWVAIGMAIATGIPGVKGRALWALWALRLQRAQQFENKKHQTRSEDMQ